MTRRLLIALALAVLVLPAAGAARSATSTTTRIVFSAAVVSERSTSFDWQIYSALPSGAGLAQLTFGPGTAANPIPSPNGRLILFSRSEQLWVMKPDGSAQRRLLVRGADPAWTPDSSHIAYSQGDGIHLIRPNGTGDQFLLRSARLPVWSADGRSLAYAYWTYERSDVAVRRNGREVLVGRFPGVSKLALSPDGRWIAVSAWDQSKGFVVHIARWDGRRKRALDNAWEPAWSPDGRTLAFADKGGLEVLDMSTGSIRNVRPDSWLTTLAWAPDGKSIAYTRGGYENRPDGSLIVTSLTGSARQVTTVGGVGRADSISVGRISTSWLGWAKVPAGSRLHTPLPPGPVVVGNELWHRAPIHWLAADGDSVAFPSCAGVYLWSRPKGAAARLSSPYLSCDATGVNATLYAFALAGKQAAIGTVYGGTHKTTTLEVLALDGQPTIYLARSDVEGGDRRGDARVGELVGQRDLLAFSSWAFCNEVGRPCAGGGAVDADRHVYATWLWRVREPSFAGGCPDVYGLGSPPKVSTKPGPCQQLASEPGPLVPLDADGGRLVAAGDNAVVVLDQTGERLVTIPVQALAAQLSESSLVVLVQGALRVYDAGTGALVHSWPLPDVESGRRRGDGNCPCGPRLLLEDAADGLAAYLFDGKVHLLRLADGADVAVADATAARFGDSGLFYSYEAPYPWKGRIRFVPFDQLPLR